MSIALEERKSDWKYLVLPYDILEKYLLAYRRKLQLLIDMLEQADYHSLLNWPEGW